MITKNLFEQSWMKKEIEALSGATSQTLKEKWNAINGDIRKLVTRAAAIVYYADERNIKIDWVSYSLVRSLRMIAFGTIDIDAWVKFQGTQIQKVLPSLSISDQNNLASGKNVTLVVFTDEGLDKRMMNPLHLDRKQINQVFSTSVGIRGEREQLAYIEAVRTKISLKRPDEDSCYEFRGNKIYFNRATLMTRGDLKTVLKILKGDSNNG